MRYIDTLISHDRKNNLELILYLVKFGFMIFYYYRGLEEIRIITIICVSVLEAFVKREGASLKRRKKLFRYIQLLEWSTQFLVSFNETTSGFAKKYFSESNKSYIVPLLLGAVQILSYMIDSCKMIIIKKYKCINLHDG